MPLYDEPAVTGSPSTAAPTTAPSIPTASTPAPTTPSAPTAPTPAAPPPVTAPSATTQAQASSLTTSPVTPAPVTREVQANETASGQLTNLFSEDNPLLGQARQSGMRQAEAAGMQNTSFGRQIGEQALFSQAVPIAAADAETYRRAAEANQNYQNTFNAAEQAYQHQRALSFQAFEQAGSLSEQGFQQALGLSQQDYLEQAQLLSQEFANQLGLSEQEQAELMEQLDRTHTLTLAELGERARLDRIQSALDQTEAMELDRLRSQLEVVQIQAQGDETMRQMEQDIVNRIQEIEAQAEAQLTVDSAADGRRLQLQYLQESGAIMRQAMQDIAAINTTEGLTAAQQQGAIRDVRRQMQSDNAVLQAYYAEAPAWDPAWGQADTPDAPATGAPATPTQPIYPGPGNTINVPDYGTIQVPTWNDPWNGARFQ